MVQIVIIEPQPLVRLGLSALMACITSSDQIKCQSYDDLYQNAPPDSPCNLVLLGARPEERVNLLIQAARHAHAPKRIVLISEPLSPPSSWANLPSVVVSYVSSAWSPEAILETLHPLLPTRHTPRNAFHHPAQPGSRPHEAIGISRRSVLPSGAGRNRGVNLEINEARMLGLTPRQYEVLVLLAQGYPIKLICRQLNISIATTKGHLEALYQRLGAHNRNEAVYIAMAHGATLQMSDKPPKAE